MVYAKVKHFVFRYEEVLALLILAVTAVWFFRGPQSKDEITIYLTIVGGVASALYFIQKQKLEELRLFKELFVEFNIRYNNINESMNRIAFSEQKGKLSTEEENTLNDYFNLCGEEFLFYRKGYIYPEVWQAWHNGMKFYLDKDYRIKEHWEREKKAESYYGLNI